jgi:hypothetical protein
MGTRKTQGMRTGSLRHTIELQDGDVQAEEVFQGINWNRCGSTEEQVAPKTVRLVLVRLKSKSYGHKLQL